MGVYTSYSPKHFALDIRLEHEVVAMHETKDGWALDVDRQESRESVEFDYAIVSIGQYAEEKHRPTFSGAAEFTGTIITEREVKSLESFRDKRIVVAGFGKSAVDMASFAAPVARVVRAFRCLTTNGSRFV